MKKVMELVTGKPLEPNHELVEMLEQLLEEAKKGECRSCAFAALMANEDVRTGYSNGSTNVFTMLGAIERLKLRYHDSLLAT